MSRTSGRGRGAVMRRLRFPGWRRRRAPPAGAAPRPAASSRGSSSVRNPSTSTRAWAAGAPWSRRRTTLPGAGRAAVSVAVSRARLTSRSSSSPSSERSCPLASGSVAATTSACTVGRALGPRRPERQPRHHVEPRRVLLQQRGPPGVAWRIGLRRHRQHGHRRGAAADLGHSLRRPAIGMQRRQRAEMLARRLGEAGAGVRLAHRHRERRLHRRGPGQQLAPDAHQRLRRQRAAVLRSRRRMIDGLPSGTIGAALAGARHPLHHARALHQQVVERIVDPVEFGAQRGEAARPAILRWWFLRRWRRGRAARRNGRNGA